MRAIVIRKAGGSFEMQVPDRCLDTLSLVEYEPNAAKNVHDSRVLRVDFTRETYRWHDGTEVAVFFEKS